MASTVETFNKIELQGSNENLLTWDEKLNVALQGLSEARSAFTTVTIGGSDVTLDATNFTVGISQHYRCMSYRLIAGASVGARNVILPAIAGAHIVHNISGFTQTLKTSGGVGAAVTTGTQTLMYCDGTDCYAMGVAGSAASAAQFRALTSGYAVNTESLTAAAAVVTLTDAATIAVDWSSFINGQVTLAGNRTLGAPTNVIVGTTRYLKIIQDGTGSRTLGYHSNYKKDSGSLTLGTTAGGFSVISLYAHTATEIHVTLHGINLS